ncbi:MAG: hypothetical protein ACI9CF_001933, partial [Candidatus Omnitrophota bacterium]
FGVMGWLMGMTGITIVGIGVVAIAIYPFTIADAPNWVRTSPYRWVRNLQKYLWVYGPLDYRGLSKKSTTTSVAAVIPDTDSGEAVIDSDSSEEAASRMGLDQFETALKVQWDAAFANGYGSVFGFDDEKRRRFETPSRKDANSDYSLLLAIADGKLRTPVWKSLDRVDLNQPLSGFNLSMVDSSEILIPEVSIAGQVWKLIINKSPLTRYHSLLIPNEVENQFFRASDAQAMAQLVNQTEFSTVYHSLWGGASVNSKHIQLLSEIAPHLTHLVANGVSNWTSVNEVSIGRPQDSPIIALKSDSPEELGKALWTLINILQEQNLPFSINGYRNHIFVAPTRNDQPSPDLYLGADGIVNTFVMRDLAKFSAPMNELVALMKSVQSQGWVSVETSQDLVAEFLIDSARMAELTEQELELLAAMGIDANTPGALLDYATGLIGAFREFDGETELQILSQDGKTGNFIPSALLPGTGYESALPIVKYADIPKDRKSLADVKLIDYTIMENGGGVGQELLRKRYVAKRGRNTLASKGFDLAFENIPYQGHIINVSVAESKLMAALTAHGQKDAYYKSHYQALVGKGSEASYEALYDLIYLPHRFDNTLSDDDKMSYRQYAESIGFDLMPLDPELPIPSIDIETNELTDAITSSGNHGRVAFSMILGAIDVNISEEERASGIHRITGFANGAGFNDSLNPEVATWMRRERIPIMMVVTVRTPTDANAGGIIGIQTFDDEINGAQARPQILEVAQARASGQFDRFKKIGLAEDEGASEGQVFNTNLGATNTTLLNLILNDLINDGVVTREDITKIITPDLIIRTKTDADGKPYYQFEGAFASSLLNLNAFFMNNERAKEILIRHTGSDKLITMVLTTSKERNDLFNLTKHSSDFWFQAYSRKFRYDTNIWGLKTNTPDIRMPAFELDGLVLDEDEAVDGEGKPKKKRAKNTKIYNYYDELQNVIDALGEKANAAELLSLTIKSNKLAELRTALTKEKIIYEKLHFRIHAAKRTIAILAESLPGSDDPELVKVQISAVRKLITEYKQSSNRSATKLEAAKRKLIDQGLGLGLVNIKDAVLVGEVEIISEYQGEVDLNDYALPKMEVDGQDHLLLSNIRVTIDKKGNVTYETIGARLSGTLPELKQAPRMSIFTPEDELLLEKMGLKADNQKAILAYVEGLVAAYREYDPNKALSIVFEGFDDGNLIPTSMLEGTGYEDTISRKAYAELPKDLESLNESEFIDYMMMVLDGGLGTSVRRKLYLSEQTGQSLDEIELGAKGTDFAFENVEFNGQLIKVSIAEAKLLAALHNSQDYLQVHYEPLVSEDSGPSYKALYDDTILPHRYDDSIPIEEKLTYRQYAKSLGFDLRDFVEELPIPTIDAETDQLTDAKTAPGSHGRVGASLVINALDEDIPASELEAGIHRISSFFNGDGINNAPNRVILTWMRREKIPIMMLATDRTGDDAKGGIIGVQILPSGDVKVKIGHPQLMEVAQAVRSSQEELFQKIGLVEGYGKVGKQDFNTNVAAINRTLLRNILKDLIDSKVATRADIVRAMAPDLIINAKIKKGKVYKQLEGAIGSVFLNLNAYFETNAKAREVLERHVGKGNKLLTIVTTTAQERTDFFTPFKFAVNFWFQAYSKKFTFETKTWSIKNNTPNIAMPSFELDALVLEDDERRYKNGKPKKTNALNIGLYNYYTESQNLIDSFGKDADASKLTSLKIYSNKLKQLRKALSVREKELESAKELLRLSQNELESLRQRLPETENKALIRGQITAVHKTIKAERKKIVRITERVRVSKAKLIKDGLGLGLVNIKNAILSGDVEIISEYQGEIDLNDYVLPKLKVGEEDRLLLSNIRIYIDNKGNVTYETIGARLSGTLPELKQAPR